MGKWWKDWWVSWVVGLVVIALQVAIGLVAFKDTTENSVAPELEVSRGMGVSSLEGNLWKQTPDDITRSRRIKGSE